MRNATRQWLVLVAIVGCGGSQAAAPAANTSNEAREGAVPMEPRNPVSKRGSGSVSAKFGASGGSLELEEGPRVELPPGAVSGGQEFTLNVAQKTTAFFNREDQRPLGPTFSFAPGLQASDGSAIEVSFPLASLPDGWGEPAIAYEVSEGAILGSEDSTRTKWQYEQARLGSGRVVAQLPAVNGLRMQFVLTNLEAQ